MDFGLTQDQRDFLGALEDFAKKEVAPLYAKQDREGRLDRGLWKKACQMGLLSMRVPIKAGGIELGPVASGLASEAIGKADPNLATGVIVVGGLCALGLQKAPLETREGYLEPMMKGDKIAAFALTEPHCGTDAAALKARAVKTSAGYKLSGEKSGVSLVMPADLAVVFARTDQKAPGAKGISAFLVPMDINGVTRQPLSDMGGKSLERGLIFLDEAEVPRDHLLGEEGEGFKIAMQGFDESRVHLALMCLGAAQATLDETIAYTKERSAFQRPIATFEGVSFVLAEHASLIESVRLLCYKALWMKEQGLKHSKEAGFVKALAPRLATNAIRDCLALHGHYGYTLDLPIEQRLRDILGLEIADGTSQVSKIVAVRELFGKEYLPYGPGRL